MSGTVGDFELPAGLDDVTPAFMTQVLRRCGLISAANEVVSQQESGVGMTAGYFSAIKKVKCTYKEPTDAQTDFVVKAWPAFEIFPKQSIREMFIKDINGYLLPADQFYPRPKVYLADFDIEQDRWILIMEDVDSFAEHKVHESELTFDEVMRMIPRLVDVAVAWEGCDSGPKAEQLEKLGVHHWTSDQNMAVYRALMPAGAKFIDKMATIEGSKLSGSPTWDEALGGPDISQLFTTRMDAFFHDARPENGATCTLSHGDMRGDNIFFCDGLAEYPDRWLCIDYQLMFRGPVPSDLAYLMGTASVLPDVYKGENLHKILREFHTRFMARTQIYKSYTYDRFVAEYSAMVTVHYMYMVAMGAAIWHQGAFHNALCARVELGGQGATEADLPPEEMRQRMWFTKCLANHRDNFKTFGHYDRLRRMPENLDGLGDWVDLPPHLR